MQTTNKLWQRLELAAQQAGGLARTPTIYHTLTSPTRVPNPLSCTRFARGRFLLMCIVLRCCSAENEAQSIFDFDQEINISAIFSELHPKPTVLVDGEPVSALLPRVGDSVLYRQIGSGRKRRRPGWSAGRAFPVYFLCVVSSASSDIAGCTITSHWRTHRCRENDTE